MTWALRKQNQELLSAERGASVFAPGARLGFALLYPNTYRVGMSNLGLHILYRQLNLRGDVACERFFLPAPGSGAPLSVETQRELADFPFIGVMLSFELDYLNLLAMLEAARLPLAAAERGEGDPLLVIGGPCATANPEPLAAVADALVIGEGEEVLGALVDCWRESAGQSRAARLLALAQLPGVYVPSLYTPLYDDKGRLSGLARPPAAPARIARQWVGELGRYAGHYQIITPNTEFSNMFVIEVARGCGRHCRFCLAGYAFRRPRQRSLAAVWRAIEERPPQAAKVGLLGAAVCDYTEISELVSRLAASKTAFSFSSLRADMLDAPLLAALAACGQRTLTIAPEAGSERLRQAINKGLGEDDILRAVDLAARAGMANVKLYFMLGLPTETDGDIEELVRLVKKATVLQAKRPGKLALSINTFIPKPGTPFQWDALVDTADRLKYVRQALKGQRQVEIRAESWRDSLWQHTLSCGDRRTGEELLAAWHEGGAQAARRFKSSRALSYQPADYLPWEHIDLGVAKEYLRQERARAVAAEPSAPCFAGCRRCGVCGG